jgi:hypothetical protein
MRVSCTFFSSSTQTFFFSTTKQQNTAQNNQTTNQLNQTPNHQRLNPNAKISATAVVQKPPRGEIFNSLTTPPLTSPRVRARGRPPAAATQAENTVPRDMRPRRDTRATLQHGSSIRAMERRSEVEFTKLVLLARSSCGSQTVCRPLASSMWHSGLSLSGQVAAARRTPSRLRT